MSNSQPTPQRFSWVKRDIIFPFILLIIVVVFAVWHGQRDNNSSTATSIPAGWSQYKADKFGFEFNYPNGWGSPQVATTKGAAGNHYQVTFGADPKFKPANKDLKTVVSMDSSDYRLTGCSAADCQTALTSKTIQTNLKTNSKSLIRHDDSSYAFLANIGGTSTLTDAQIVNLSKVKVSAVLGIYSLAGTGSCPAGKFAPSAQPGCIGPGDYDTLNQVLKSFKAI